MYITAGDIPLLCLVFAVLVAGIYFAIKTTARAYHQKEVLLWVAGLIGWFIYQFLFVELLWTTKAPFFIVLASVPISLLLVLLLNLLKKSSIAGGMLSAIVSNAVILVSLSQAGVYNNEGIGALFIIFPPFFLGYLIRI